MTEFVFNIDSALFFHPHVAVHAIMYNSGVKSCAILERGPGKVNGLVTAVVDPSSGKGLNLDKGNYRRFVQLTM